MSYLALQSLVILFELARINRLLPFSSMQLLLEGRILALESSYCCQLVKQHAGFDRQAN